MLSDAACAAGWTARRTTILSFAMDATLPFTKCVGSAAYPRQHSSCAQACYGVIAIPAGDWYCDSCVAARASSGDAPPVKQCALCPTIGGALKPTTATAWVHASCALWMPGALCQGGEAMSSVDVSAVDARRFKLKCCVCKERQGACVQCSCRTCAAAFHVTCGLQRGWWLLQHQVGTAALPCLPRLPCAHATGLSRADWCRGGMPALLRQALAAAWPRHSLGRSELHPAAEASHGGAQASSTSCCVSRKAGSCAAQGDRL